MPEYPCFMLTRTARARQSLRRFVFTGHGNDCPKGSYHHAETILPECELALLGPDGEPWEGHSGTDSDVFQKTDPAWPTTCSACGYAFQDQDEWQHNRIRLYEDPRSPGNRFVLDQAPIGSMWDAYWLHDVGSKHNSSWTGEDGLSLAVMTPGGIWLIDGPADGGGRWTRTGIPPNVTVTPSIQITGHTNGYHGWLRDGKLVDA